MSVGDIEVPEEVRLKALFQGTQGRQWLADLSRLVRELEQKWGGRRAHPQRRSESYVATATTPGGEAAVVELEIPPYEHFEGEVKTLLAAEGRHQQMALPPFDLLGPVVTALFSAHAGGLDRLGVHYCGTRLRIPHQRYPHPLAQGRVHPFPDPAQAPGSEVVVDGPPAVGKS